MRKIFITAVALFVTLSSFANEGMWIMPNIPDSISSKMEEMGMDIDIETIYSEKNKSLKDVTVYLTTGYTATILSDNGLIIAPYKALGNFLPKELASKDGFKSSSIYNEVNVPGVGAWVLKSTQDVTYRIAPQIKGINSEKKIKHTVDSIASSIYRGLVLPANNKAKIAETSTGNYYLYVYECYNDVRVAYIPPYSIANEDLANDRHAADFMLLRIYSDRDNKPSEYNNSNKFFEPINSAVISSNKHSENDFVFTLGFPNKSSRQILSSEIYEKYITKPLAATEILTYLDTINYKSFKKAITNNEKAVSTLQKSGIIESKKSDERSFTIWAANQSDFSQLLRYANVITKVDTLYSKRKNDVITYEHLNTLCNNINTIEAANLMLEMNDNNEEESFEKLNTYFVTLDIYKERQMLTDLLGYIETHIDPNVSAVVFDVEKTKYKGNREKYIKDIFAKSFLTDDKRYMKYLDKPSDGAIRADILVDLADRINKVRIYYYSKSIAESDEINHLTRLYKEGQGFEKPYMTLTPDANYSLRMSYGKIAGYSPDEITEKKSKSTLSGVFNHSYLLQKTAVDSLLTSLYYSTSNAKDLAITFLVDCDMASGRSGYGVYDYNGDLIGMVTSNNAEAANNTFVYDSGYQRLVALDINYALFIIKNYANIEYILKEFNFGEKEKFFEIKSVNPEPEKSVE